MQCIWEYVCICIWDELGCWAGYSLITVFGTAQGSRGAFGADPCGLYVCIHWYWNENVIWLVWAMKRKLKWDMRKRELLYMIDSFEEKGWDLFYDEIIINWE